MVAHWLVPSAMRTGNTSDWPVHSLLLSFRDLLYDSHRLPFPAVRFAVSFRVSIYGRTAITYALRIARNTRNKISWNKPLRLHFQVQGLSVSMVYASPCVPSNCDMFAADRKQPVTTSSNLFPQVDDSHCSR